MFLKSNVKAMLLLTASAGLLLAASRFGLAQEISDDDLDTLDEIIVYGEPTLRLLRDEVWQAEEDFYELFNALNKGRQFDVTCFMRKKLGSQVSRRVCEAYFVKSPPNNGVSTFAYYKHKTRQMQREMVALMEQHPELHDALYAYYDAKKSFDMSFRDRCGNRLAICKK